MPVVTTTSLPPAIQASFNQKLLSVPTPNNIYKIPATKYTKPRNTGDIIRFRRYDRLAPALVPLGNTGVTPPGQVLNAIDIDAKMQFYGTFVEINEQTVLQNEEKVLNETALLLGIDLAETEDILVRDMLAASAAAIDAVGGVNGDDPTEVTLSDLNSIAQTLRSNNAYSQLNTIEGENKYGTSPVRNAFFALCSTDLQSDLDGVTGFKQTAFYSQQGPIMESEYGSVSQFRFLVSSNGSKINNASANGNDVYNISCVAAESYACVDQDGYNAEFVYRGPLYSGPLGLNVTLGFKTSLATRIQNAAWVLNLKVTQA